MMTLDWSALVTTDWYAVVNKSVGMGGAAVVIWVAWNALNFYRQHAARQKAQLKTVTARFGYFLRAVCSLAALLLVVYGGLFAYGESNGLLFACMVWGFAFVVWLLGRGLFFVLAGTITNTKDERANASPRSSSVPSVPEIRT